MIDQIRDKLKNEFVTVTDIPKETGGYDYKPEDKTSQADIFAAQAAVGKNADQVPRFWQLLANSVGQHKVARCTGCTAYAARCLEGLAKTNGKNLLICGIADFDHHVLLVSDKTATYGQKLSGQGNADFVVDLWQFNLDRQTSGNVNLDVLANYAGEHAYTKNQSIKVFACFN